jgi:superfamily II DNA or RNA helicase
VNHPDDETEDALAVEDARHATDGIPHGLGIPTLDPRRNFTRKEIWRAWATQGKVCQLCRRRIPFDLMHGDHIVPWSRGGRTAVDNLQALCGSCNLRKGSQAQEVAEQRFRVDLLSAGSAIPRAWQTSALQVTWEHIRTEPVLIEACPGAGKTQFGLEVAYQMVVRGEITRVLIVVPTIGIADGWQRAASMADPYAPSLPLHSQRDWRAVDPIGDQWLGAIITYQSLFASTEMFLAHATDPGHKTLVIFDEVHHAAAGAAWGVAAQEAFAAGAHAILALSGTPFRTAGDPIVFIPTVEGEARPHYRYSYDEAIRDRACRPVQFVEARGETTFRTEDNVVHTVDFDNVRLTTLGENRRLRSALEWVEAGSIAAKMLMDANQYLLGLRKTDDPDAAGLVVCVDCDHAARVAAFIGGEVARRRPTFACSRMADANDPGPANAIKRFRTAASPWIVAVNMVSEGVDIPRLRAVVYLTNRLTLLSFRQIVGRVVRSDPRNRNDHGRVYIPADERLARMAQQVTDTPHLLPPPMRIDVEPAHQRAVRVEGQGRLDSVPFEVVSTSGAQGSVFDTNGRLADRHLVTCAQRFIAAQGLSNTDAESLAMAALDSPSLFAELLKYRDSP